MESAEDQRNRIATDILECPQCGGEKFNVMRANLKKSGELSSQRLRCKECRHEFTEYE